MNPEDMQCQLKPALIDSLKREGCMSISKLSFFNVGFENNELAENQWASILRRVTEIAHCLVLKLLYNKPRS